jgi:hypothetical protein
MKRLRPLRAVLHTVPDVGELKMVAVRGGGPKPDFPLRKSRVRISRLFEYIS